MPLALCCMSHSPLLNLPGPSPDLLDEIDSALTKARDFVGEYDPELVVIFSPDHYNGFFYKLMPPFCIGTAAVGVGDFGTQAGALNVAGGHRVRHGTSRSGCRNRRRDLGEHGGGPRHGATSPEAVRRCGLCAGRADLRQLGCHTAWTAEPFARARCRSRQLPGDVGQAGARHWLRRAFARSAGPDARHRTAGRVGPDRARPADDNRAATWPDRRR